ncbi:MAG TPA: outer membrane beta-barrel protein [Phnomibacter sp.]|nr:outer membrane beta-barrel protein [Phnomibacter sp.]
MKHALLLAAASLAALASYSQTDTTQTIKNRYDTIRIGGMLIVKKGPPIIDSGNHKRQWYYGKRKPKKLETSYFTMDFGFNNFIDKTDYTSPAAREYARAIRPGEAAFTESDFNLRNGKSINFNLWLVRQKWGITKDRVMQLTYGLMLETNNYRYDNNITYVRGSRPYVFRDSLSFSKNKLAADYLTVPVMLGFNTRPGKGGFTMSAGVSIGYLYSSRNKQISEPKGKQKIRGSFDLEPWKFQYIAEIGAGPVKLYGSYAPQSMYKRGLDIRPFNVGIRFGDW